ncbi:hypothetical protein [Thalassoglobus polymorphus]|uniref:Uncharacterized protein n=1 Tax=Thalassoglobus polymorphus TaxID=2527994 RepID=A0A517QH10_9PLAN|nr:hypothetical protein [Thalassoglobus polymorphus]QDT30918.1 hypothetical protein Mal48_01470 [Thalassoglobus polymorphus]QDT30963.1 hypothetical protein Mal48_01920 [Thalassoglobus polymorphus]
MPDVREFLDDSLSSEMRDLIHSLRRTIAGYEAALFDGGRPGDDPALSAYHAAMSSPLSCRADHSESATRKLIRKKGTKPSSRKWMSYQEARTLVHSLRIPEKTGKAARNGWRAYWKENNRPDGLPFDPISVYKDFVDWSDFLGMSANELSGEANRLEGERIMRVIVANRIESVSQYRSFRKDLAGEVAKLPAYSTLARKEWFKGFPKVEGSASARHESRTSRVYTGDFNAKKFYSYCIRHEITSIKKLKTHRRTLTDEQCQDCPTREYLQKDSSGFLGFPTIDEVDEAKQQ